jgi:hypothetical protein
MCVAEWHPAYHEVYTIPHDPTATMYEILLASKSKVSGHETISDIFITCDISLHTEYANIPRRPKIFGIIA